jgi:hypothetical protein
VIKAYSPPIDPDLLPKDGSKPDPPILDATILKIEAGNLPTVRLAPSIKQVYLGQQLVIVGYPGVVVWHDFLSKKSRAEATVTYGRVSSFREDVNDRQILQTDAPTSWGNSGGPAFTVNGEVIGLATSEEKGALRPHAGGERLPGGSPGGCGRGNRGNPRGRRVGQIVQGAGEPGVSLQTANKI